MPALLEFSCEERELAAGGTFLCRGAITEHGAAAERRGHGTLVADGSGKVGERFALIFNGAGEAIKTAKAFNLFGVIETRSFE